MTEQEWLTCEVPQQMLEFVQGRIGYRQCWCFVAACLRRSLPALSYCTTTEGAQRSTERLELLDRVIAGIASNAEVELFYSHTSATRAGDVDDAWGQALVCSLNAAGTVAQVILWTRRFANRTAERRAAAREAALLAARDAERVAQSALLRCIVGNPFRPVSLDPAWLSPTVLALAQAAYDHRILPAGMLDNARLMVLANALEDAGCDNANLLNHCRSEGPHVRGCSVVDLLLGKT